MTVLRSCMGCRGKFAKITAGGAGFGIQSELAGRGGSRVSQGVLATKGWACHSLSSRSFGLRVQGLGFRVARVLISWNGNHWKSEGGRTPNSNA